MIQPKTTIVSAFGLGLLWLASTASASTVFEFDKPTLADCGWSEQFPGGFTSAPAGSTEFLRFYGNPFASSQDNRGMIITVDPGEITFLNAKAPIATQGKPMLLRVTVRADGPAAQVALVALKGDLSIGAVDGSIATHIPAGAAEMVDRERRLTLVYEADSGEWITPALQVAAIGSGGSVSVAVDCLEVISLERDTAYPGAEFAARTDSVLLPTATPTAVSPTLTPTPPVPTNTPAPAASHTPTPIVPTATPSAGGGEITEKEPNDAQPQPMGALSAGKGFSFHGALASGGMSQEKYVGDPDLVSFELTEAADVSLSLDWTGAADVDVYILLEGTIIGGENQAGKPIRVSGTMGPSTYTLLVVSKNQAADYRFEIKAAAASKPVYPNEAGLLNGKFINLSDSEIMYWYVFDGKGNYASWTWSARFGSVPADSGTYAVRYPFLFLYHDGKTEMKTLAFLNENALMLNQDKYIRE